MKMQRNRIKQMHRNCITLKAVAARKRKTKNISAPFLNAFGRYQRQLSEYGQLKGTLMALFMDNRDKT
jgi:hypothetical protein